MVDTENVVESVTEISSFPLMVLEEGNDLLHQNSATDEFKDKFLTDLELMEVTVMMLEAFYEVSEDDDDRLYWKNLASQYRLIFIAFNNTLLKKSIPSIIFCGKSEKETDGLPGRPRYNNISAETLEELRGVGFTWEKISKIFGVSRITTRWWVTEYGLENISWFSTISDQELDTLILDFFVRHKWITGQNVAGWVY